MRFYKEPEDTGAHIGSLWSSSGTLLASGTFTGETASGWQELDFSSPVAITAGTTYVASYFSSTGYPAATPAGLASAVTNGPLTALAGGGVYAYGSTNTFPTNTYNNNNYWVDVVYSQSSGATVPGAPSGVSATGGNGSAVVSWTAPNNGGSAITSYTVTPYVGSAAQTPVTVSGSPPATSTTVSGLTNGTSYTFTVSATNAVGTGQASSSSNAVTPTGPPSVTSVTPNSGASGVAVSVAPSATFSQAVTPSTVSFKVVDSGGNSVAGSVGFNAADTVATFTPNSSLAAGVTYTATVSGAQNASGTPMSSPYSWNFTTAGPQCPCSIWQDGTPTGSIDANDTSAQTSGVKFTASSSGFIAGVRFYKESDDTGAHIGSLWSSSGTLLASGTFTGETASGWQELDFSSPVAITAGTTYVASYFSSTGHPAATAAGLASAVTNGPLTALAGGGVYAVGSSNTFPTSTYNNNNYWVDVVYSPTAGATPPVVSTVSPAAGYRQRGVDRAVGDVLAGGDAEHGVVYGEGFGREQCGWVGGVQCRRHGGDVHAEQLAGRQHDVYGDGVGGAECLRHADERPVFVEFHHRCGGSVPVQHLAGRDADRRGRFSGSERADLGGEVHGLQQRVRHRGAVLQRAGGYRRAYREPVEFVGDAAGVRDVHRRDGQRMAGAGLLFPGGDHRGDDVRGVVLLQYRVSGGDPRRAGVGGDQRAADRAGRRRGVRLRLHEHLPHQYLQQQQLLGRRRLLAVLTQLTAYQASGPKDL